MTAIKRFSLSLQSAHTGLAAIIKQLAVRINRSGWLNPIWPG
jgi:hypothetical protein